MSEIDKQIAEHKSCADRINDSLESREQYMHEMLNAMDNGEPFDGYDDGSDAFFEYMLGYSKKTVFKFELSWGGPSDYIEVAVCEDGNHYEIEKVTYHFADWFDHASLVLDNSSPLWDFVERYLDVVYSS